MGGNTMTPTLEALGIDQLSVADKLELIERIWDSLPASPTLEEVPEWHLAELQKRLARADANPGEGKPWREVLARLEGKS
jgi:putative addiction module component (TIGR02574 family)